MALTDSLLAYWTLDEASGNRADATGNGYTLTENGTVGSAAGKVSNAADFPGSSGNTLSNGSGDSLDPAGSWTIAFWVKFDALNAFQAFWSIAGNGVELRLNGGASNFQLSVLFPPDTLNSAETPTTGTWYHVVWYYDDTNHLLGIVVNNGTPTTKSYTRTTTSSGQTLYVGGRAAALPHDGLLDEIGLWGRVLTSGEWTSLYNAGAGLAYPFSGGGGVFSWANYYYRHVGGMAV